MPAGTRVCFQLFSLGIFITLSGLLLSCASSTREKELMAYFAAPTIKKVNEDLSLTLSSGEQVRLASVKMPAAGTPDYEAVQKLLRGYMTQHVSAVPSAAAEGSMVRVIPHPDMNKCDGPEACGDELNLLNYLLVSRGLAEYVEPAVITEKDPDYLLMAQAKRFADTNEA